MPIYCFSCKCGEDIEVVRPMSQSGEFQMCVCGKKMNRDYQAMNIMSGNKEYGKAIISDSLAMNPNQIPEHNRLFPDIKVLPDGRPVFDNYQKHDAYLKKTGFEKARKKIKKKGKRIA